MIKPFVHHASEVVLTTPIFRVRKDRLSHPRSGHTADYFVLENPDWVNVVALTSAGKLLLVRQWRVGAKMVDLELPAGLIERGESPEAAAARELREETGYAAGRVTLIGRSQPNSAYQQNTCFTALALDCTPTGSTAFDPGEDIELVEVAPAELPRLIAAGDVRNALVITALYFWLASEGRLELGALGVR